MNSKTVFFLFLILMVLMVSDARSDETDQNSQKVSIWEYPANLQDSNLISMDATGIQIQLEDQKKKIPFENLVRITFPKNEKSQIDSMKTSLVLLENGNRLFVLIEKIEDDFIIAKWNEQSRVMKIPVETVRAIMFHYSSGEHSSHKLLQKVFKTEPSNDYYFLVNGDNVSGELTGMDSTSVNFESRSGQRSISKKQIAAIVMNRDLVSFPETKTKYQMIQFENGSWISCHSLETDDQGRLSVDSIAGMKFSTGLDTISSITFFNSKVQSLSHLKPTRYHHVPYLSQSKSLKINRNNQDSFLKVNNVEYPFGLGMYSKSSVTFQLSGQFQKLHAILGIDNEGGKYGNVIFSIEADRRKIYESPQTTRLTSPVKIEGLNLNRCMELKLIVDYGDFGDIQDIANWCDLLLIK